MNEDTRYPVTDVERATVEVLSRTPLLCALGSVAREDIAREVRRGTTRRLSQDHREQTTLPAMHGAVLESLKETTLFCVLIGSKLRLLADHVVREVRDNALVSRPQDLSAPMEPAGRLCGDLSFDTRDAGYKVLVAGVDAERWVYNKLYERGFDGPTRARVSVEILTAPDDTLPNGRDPKGRLSP